MDLLIVNCQLDSNNPVLASSIAKFIKKHSTDISSVFMLQHCYSWIDVRYASNWMFVDDNKHATPGQRVEKVQGQPMIEGRVVKYIFGPIPKLDEKITLIEDVYLFGTPGVGFYPCIVDAIREAGLLTNLIVEEIDSEHAPNMFAFSSESKLLVVGDYPSIDFVYPGLVDSKYVFVKDLISLNVVCKFNQCWKSTFEVFETSDTLTIPTWDQNTHLNHHVDPIVWSVAKWMHKLAQVPLKFCEPCKDVQKKVNYPRVSFVYGYASEMPETNPYFSMGPTNVGNLPYLGANFSRIYFLLGNGVFQVRRDSNFYADYCKLPPLNEDFDLTWIYTGYWESPQNSSVAWREVEVYAIRMDEIKPSTNWIPENDLEIEIAKKLASFDFSFLPFFYKQVEEEEEVLDEDEEGEEMEWKEEEAIEYPDWLDSTELTV